jgi:hypothetical protein
VSVVAGTLLILVVAAAVASPLLQGSRTPAAADRPADKAEVLRREKSVALIAIKEADFDLAMGKLSNDDYATLRAVYEERALGALDALDALDLATASPDDGSAARQDGAAAFCTACGMRFRTGERFCGSCGAARRDLSA